jgi:hypothetical protein
MSACAPRSTLVPGVDRWPTRTVTYGLRRTSAVAPRAGRHGAPQTWGPQPCPQLPVVRVLFRRPYKTPRTSTGCTRQLACQMAAAGRPGVSERQTGHRVTVVDSTVTRPASDDLSPGQLDSALPQADAGGAQQADGRRTLGEPVGCGPFSHAPARYRLPAHGGGQTCPRRGAAAHPPLPLEAL